jgi:hypothetical protein
MSAATFKDRLDTAEVVDIWPDPTPLPTGLPAVQPFNFALLPEPLQPWVQDISERMQAPADFIAVTALVAAGSIIGRKVGTKFRTCGAASLAGRAL